ncbi:glycosyltransferase family 2 protein [Dongia sp.]|uniref:glycosyltransferase family 2 protein n=1 Tax=Dongia sp. TaxID=1977262 RepID=UPI0035AE97F4
MTSACELTILMPCLNEAETLAVCIRKARKFLADYGVSGEVLIADNGSTDGSQEIARSEGARVADIPVKGYGAALIGGIEAAAGRFVIMGDSDDSYDFSNLMPFVERLRAGADLVMGNRFKGGIKPGAMPPLHRYLGNPVLTGIGKILFNSPLGDFHCGLRGFSREAIRALDLRTTGMEFASEMIVKATLNGLKIAEVPTTLSPDGRSRPPHLRSWRDGWRHLRFLLMLSPEWLFFYPGLIIGFCGFLMLVALTLGPLRIANVTFDINTLLLAGIAVIVGAQAVGLAVLAKQFCIANRLLPPSARFRSLADRLSLELLLVIGGLLTVAGLIGIVVAVLTWREAGFGNLDTASMMRLLVPASTSLCVGLQLAFTAFFKGVLGLAHR